jgi:hypothetical protein
MHVIFKISIYSSSELTVLKLIQKKVINLLCEGKKNYYSYQASGSLASLRTWRQLAAKVGTSKGRGKQWQTTPKNLPRMQRTRAIPIA